MNAEFLHKVSEEILHRYQIDRSLYGKFDVKRGLRNADGSGVLAGLTKISSVIGSRKENGKLVPVEGELRYRGIDIRDLVSGIQEDGRHGFSEVTYLLLFAKLPTRAELKEFEAYLYPRMALDKRLIATTILQFTSSHVMNAMQRVVLTLYSLDENPDDISIPNVVRQCLELIAKFPAIIAYSYRALRNKFHGDALFINPPKAGYDIAENFLHMLRPTSEFSKLEAEILDLALVLHAEHGGGNNSSFTTHVVSSSNTDTYSAIAAALGSLKGPLHGAANANVMYMMANIKENVKDWADRDEVAAYIEKILRKEAHDRTGLVYGMGHAVYTKSDPRAKILKEKARELAEVKGRMDEFNLYTAVEELTPGLFQKVKQSDKVISPNVDFFSGFVYDMLGFPVEIYTPLFAMARVVGWSAHRMDELINGGRIIRPAYKSVAEPQPYVPIDQRK
ncbi:MAG: citrate/2-methylcitrate synthase [Calditrichaeota bacterium]|nr:MAG: citrate/2-methylcitrate synthase [Calditrichota bacterium]